MAIQTGDRIPAATLGVMRDGAPATLETTDFFAGRRVLLFAVPGAFTPTCSARHLPGFIDHLDDFRAAGFDSIACMSVNDVYVMDAWGKAAGADGIEMLADGNAAFSRALGLDVDAASFSCFHYSCFLFTAHSPLMYFLFTFKLLIFSSSSSSSYCI